MNVTMLLQMAAQAVGDRDAVIDGDTRLTYDDLVLAAGRWAEVIGSAGVDSVAYLGENSAEAVSLFFGSAAAGVSYVPVNYRWTDAQLEEALGQLGSVAVVTDARSAPRVTGLQSVTVLERPSGGPGAKPIDTDGEFPAVLLFTSGTSGTPKAAVLRNRHLVPYVVTTVEFLAAEEDEAILVSVPPYHIAAVSSMLTSVYAGRRMVLLPAFEPRSWVQTVRRESATQAMVVPTMLDRILDVVEQDGLGLPSLRHLSYGGGRMPMPVVERALALMPDIDLVNAYGLTETSSTISLLGPEDHRAAVASDDPRVLARLGSVGRPLPSVEIEIRDDEDTVLGVNEAGEIWVRGDQVSGEYLSHSAIDESGWYPTRDHGHLDEAGFLFLHGRTDDVIVRGGENIAPAEIEDRLREHPAVADVGVVGVPSQEWGEQIEAFVVPAGPVDVGDLSEWVRVGLRSTRVPRWIHLREELPYNETGKLLRRELKAERAAVGELPA